LADPQNCGGCADEGGQVCDLRQLCLEGSCVTNCVMLTPTSYPLSVGGLGLDWSSDGTFLATTGDRMPNPSGQDLQVWRFDGELLSFLDGATLMIQGRSPAWSPDGTWLALGGSDAALSRNLAAYGFDGTSLSQLTSEYPSAIFSLDIHPSGVYVATGSFSGELRVWSFDASTYTIVHTGYSDGKINDLEWSPNGAYLAVGSSAEGTNDAIQIYAWNGSILSLLASRHVIDDVKSIAWSPDGTKLLAGLAQGTQSELLVLGFDGVALTTIAAAETESDVQDLDWSPGGDLVAAVGENLSGDLDLMLWSFDGAILTLEPGGSMNLGPLTCAAFHPSGNYIATAGDFMTGANNLFLLPVCTP